MLVGIGWLVVMVVLLFLVVVYWLGGWLGWYFYVVDWLVGLLLLGVYLCLDSGLGIVVVLVVVDGVRWFWGCLFWLVFWVCWYGFWLLVWWCVWWLLFCVCVLVCLVWFWLGVIGGWCVGIVLCLLFFLDGLFGGLWLRVLCFVDGLLLKNCWCLLFVWMWLAYVVFWLIYLFLCGIIFVFCFWLVRFYWF